MMLMILTRRVAPDGRLPRSLGPVRHKLRDSDEQQALRTKQVLQVQFGRERPFAHPREIEPGHAGRPIMHDGVNRQGPCKRVVQDALVCIKAPCGLVGAYRLEVGAGDADAAHVV